MSKNLTVSALEPAERPFTLNVSAAEIIALVRHHQNQSKRVPKILGKLLMDKSSSGFPRGSDMAVARKEAEKILNAHLTRARGLLSILK